jgi:hypothetical protein
MFVALPTYIWAFPQSVLLFWISTFLYEGNKTEKYWYDPFPLLLEHTSSQKIVAGHRLGQ